MYVCNGCHDIMQIAVNFNDGFNVSVKANEQRIHFWYMSKNEATNLRNADLKEKGGTL